jgi:2-polyprenyl-3-methyl-5-hydroxy-6-metoxy-1,4-benzoquinol methylase
MHTSNGKTKEPQYQECVEAVNARGFERLGLRSSQSWYEDPKHLLFRLSRYKFVAKMLSGYGSVLEIGCGDCFGTRLVQQEVKTLDATDFDPLFIEEAKGRMTDKWHFDVFTHDMLSGPVSNRYDAVYALDVLEHISKTDELLFLKNSFDSLNLNGVGIIGMPTLESQVHASPASKIGHVNCKSMPDLKKLMHHYFNNVFMFSMNDEVVHTGYHPMAHYIFAIGANLKR